MSQIMEKPRTWLKMLQILVESIRWQDNMLWKGCVSADDYRKLIRTESNIIVFEPKLHHLLEFVDLHLFKCEGCGALVELVADKRLPPPWIEDLAVRMHAYRDSCHNPVLGLVKPAEDAEGG